MDTENPKRRKTFATRGDGGAERAVTREKPTDASRSFAASATRINSASCGLRRASPRARSRRRPGRNSARDREKRVGLEPRGAPEPAPVASRETRKAPGRGEAHEEARGRWVARRTLPTRSCDARCRKGSRGRDGGPTEGFIIRHAKSEKPKTIRNRHVLPRQFRRMIMKSAAQPPQPVTFFTRSALLPIGIRVVIRRLPTKLPTTPPLPIPKPCGTRRLDITPPRSRSRRRTR